MGGYSVPEHIRACKPKGTMVKAIGGHYYVYEYRSVVREGKRKTEMGRCIGSIKEGVGFAPNSSRAKDAEITTLEFGQYALALASSERVHAALKEHFNPADAATLYTMAVVNCVNGATPLKDVASHYAQSLLRLRFPELKVGPGALGGLVDALGRRQGGVLAFEQALCDASGAEVAVDGHAMPSSSALNDLAEPGYRRSRLGADQVNLLMAYDVASGVPLMSRAYEGALLDKASVRDLLSRHELSGRLFVADSGFYSAANLESFTAEGNSYIIPLHKGIKACREAVASERVDGRFVHRRNRRASVIEYGESRAPSGARVILYRDLNKAALECAGYLAKVEQGAKGYSAEGLDAMKGVMGVIVLQTSREDMTCEEVYAAYRRRWHIETFFDYLKNRAGFTSLGVQDYCKAQGLAFMMLVTALVHKCLEEACATVKGRSVDDCLLEARMIKINKVGTTWTCCNAKSKQRELFEAVGAPLSVEALLQHT